MTARRGEWAAVAGLAVVAVLAWALVPTYPNYDAYFHLVWGRELAGGAKPAIEVYGAPTEHPLYLWLCAALSVLGTPADRTLVLVTVLSFVALVWATFCVGRACFGSPWPGLAAAFFVGSSFAFLIYAARAYVDVPFLALVLWAAALEAARPGRGVAVLAPLAVAGLLRPEAWVLAGLYWLWLARRARRPPWALLGLVLAAPVAWALFDLWLTGDPLHSLHATSELADELGRPRGVGEVPRAFVAFLADTARPPVALAAVLGAALVWRFRARVRAVHVLAGLFGAGGLTFLAAGLAGLSILPRYLTVPVVGLCLLAGFAFAGFTTLPADHRARTWWRRAAAALLVLGLVFVAVRATVVERLVTELRFGRDVHRDLVAILDDAAVRRDVRCGPLSFPNYRLVPDARWVLDLPAGRVVARSDRRPAFGVAIFVLGEKMLRRYGFADGASPSTNVPDPGFAPIARTGRFVAYARCPRR